MCPCTYFIKILFITETATYIACFYRQECLCYVNPHTMSTYQLYDFYSIDRPLTNEELKEVSQLSSRVEPTARRATFVYHYSDFRHNELTVLNDYFDMMLYTANWGTWQLAIKVPADVVSLRELRAYIFGDDDYGSHIEIIKKGDNIIIDLYKNEEDGGGWMDYEGTLDGMLGLREQILDGDYRLLYIAWLHLASQVEHDGYDDGDYYDEDEDGELTEPPVPDNLHKLGISLENFVDFWEIDPHLIEAATAKSASNTKSEDWESHLAKLKASQKDDILKLLLTNEAKAKQELKKHLRKFTDKPETNTQERRTLADIMDVRAKVHQKAAEAAEKAAQEAYRKKMEGIGKLESAMWKEVDYNASLKKSKGYDQAAEMLKDLQDYALYANKLVEFQKQLGSVLEVHKSVALRRRLQRNKVL